MSDDVKTWCPRCGPDVRLDESGILCTCGSAATGKGADMAHAQRSYLKIYKVLYEMCERQRSELILAIEENVEAALAWEVHP